MRPYKKLYWCKAWRRLREEVMAEAKGLCQLCAAEGRVKAAREVDHIVPVSRMNIDMDSAADRERFYSRTNLQALCSECHKAKSDTEKRPSTRWAKYEDWA